MKLMKQKSRSYKGKDYSKYSVVVPSKVVSQLHLKRGDELDVKVKGKKLILVKD